MPKVCILTSITDVLKQLSLDRIRKSRKIYVKINMVSAYTLLSMTPPQAIEELLHFLRSEMKYTGRIIIAEGSAGGSTADGFRRVGVTNLIDQYDIELFNIHDDDYYEIPLFDRHFNEIIIPISKSLVNAETLISICRAKTHDTVIVTLTIKNVAVGGIVGKENRPKIHQGYPAINFNIAILGAIMFPDIGLIDGRVGMEGDGPVSGTSKEWGYVFGGENAVEVDAVTAYAMGFDARNIGYLYYLHRLGFGKIDSLEIVGYKLDDVRTKFVPHSEYNSQLKWRLDKEMEEEILSRARRIIQRYSRRRNIVNNT